VVAFGVELADDDCDCEAEAGIFRYAVWFVRFINRGSERLCADDAAM
jgi:hypothetical protein